MADISHTLVFEALTRAAAAPAGLPLHAARHGMFPAGSSARSAAQRCKDDGLVHVLRCEARGKEICGLTEKGLAFLLQNASPRPVLQAFVEALQARRQGLDELLAEVRRQHDEVDALRASAERVLEKIAVEAQAGPPQRSDDVSAAIRHELTRWHEAGLLGDCPLPELFRRLQATFTIGAFHDALRLLHVERQVYLHPWTGPLYELPEPALALLVGHEIAYYASLRI